MDILEKQIEDFIANLKGRLTYETKKAARLGYSSIQDYVRNKLSQEALKTVQKTVLISAKKSVKAKSKKKKKLNETKCGCCP